MNAMMGKTLTMLVLAAAVLVGCGSGKTNSQDSSGSQGKPDWSDEPKANGATLALPVRLQIIEEGEVYSNPESAESWTIYVQRPISDAHQTLKSQLDADGGWDTRSRYSYRKTIGGKSYEISVMKGKAPIDNEQDDPNAWDTWTMLFLRRI